jgi:NAD+ synthase (glutamine-hydrolysing)
MLIMYLMAQLVPKIYQRESFLLVLGCTGMDDIIIGNLRKYDTSSADLNPVGSLCKKDIKGVLEYFK